MSLLTHAVSAPPGRRVLYLLEIALGEAVLRYAEDVRDWTVTHEDLEEATYIATGFDAEAQGADDSGVDTRDITVPDLGLTLWHLIEDNIGGEAAITATVREYFSDDLGAPQRVRVLELAEPELDRERNVSFTATTADTINRSAPGLKYTVANSPGLRR